MTELTKIPQHVAIIMDGNGRWATQKGMPRIRGHQEGADRLEEIMRASEEFGVKYLTLYAFSKENWLRPKEEVNFLMKLLSNYLDRKLAELQEQNVVFNAIGHLEDMPSVIQQKLKRNIEATKNNTGLTVTFAFSYSSRWEITQACRRIAEDVRDGKIKADDVNEETISRNLYTHNLPDPDLLVRTSGEMRISNFLLWQISYAEIYVTEKFWPEFNKEELRKALEAYAGRERRFGRTEPVESERV